MKRRVLFQNETYQIIAGATMLVDVPGKHPATVMKARHPDTGNFCHVRLFTPSDLDPLTEIESVEVVRGNPPRCVIKYKGGKEENLRLNV